MPDTALYVRERSLRQWEWATGRVPRPKQRHLETTIAIDDLSRRTALYGPADRNLRLIRAAFDVRISARDGTVRISGSPEAVAKSVQVIEQLQRSLRVTPDISDEVVEETIRRTKAERSARPGEREAGERELALLQRLREALEREEPLRTQELSPDDRRIISGYQLLTNKPLLILANIDESEIGRAEEIESALAARWAGPSVEVAALSGKLEAELTELSDEEAAEFRRDLGLAEGGLERMIRLSHHVLGLISFFTVGEPEGRAWALRAGSTALDAAGKIHSDIARGFIRAETIGWDELLDCGSLAEARKRGLLRREGKGHIIQDGEVLNILFNV